MAATVNVDIPCPACATGIPVTGHLVDTGRKARSEFEIKVDDSPTMGHFHAEHPDLVAE